MKRNFKNTCCEENKESKKERQKQSQINYQTQELLVDQNYANNILLMVFSTLESLAGLQNDKKLSKSQKIYGYYDKYDYKNKNLEQLISQLQIHLLNFQTSKRLFQKKYGLDKYILPSKFNRSKFESEINNFEIIFKNNDFIRNMVKDFSNLMSDVNCQTSYMKSNFQSNHPQKSHQHGKHFISSAIESSHIMRDQREKIINGNVQYPQQLPVQLNQEVRPWYYFYKHN